MRIRASETCGCICLGLLHVATAFSAPSSPPTAPFPVQLEMAVPFEPTAFAGDGSRVLAYELYITNFTPNPAPTMGMANRFSLSPMRAWSPR
jgi:hypothetical protein